MRKEIVYIAHQIGGDVKENLEKIHLIYEELTLKDEVIPFAPYLTGFLFLSDEITIHRELGIKNNKGFFEKRSFDKMIIYGDNLSKGVLQEIDWCIEYGIPFYFDNVMTYAKYSDLQHDKVHKDTVINALLFRKSHYAYDYSHSKSKEDAESSKKEIDKIDLSIRKIESE